MDYELRPGERHPLRPLKEEPLFLNVDDPTQAWTFAPAADLLINAPEGEEYNTARLFLRPFESLLLKSGAKRIAKSLPSRPGASASELNENLLAMSARFNKLRHEGRFTDVIIVDRDGGEHRAHRMVLVCHSDHLEEMFLGRMAMLESRDDAHPGDPVRVELREMYSGQCLDSALGQFD